MFFRFILPVILTYLIFRSIGNLIRAARGQSNSQHRVNNSGGSFRFDIRNTSGSMHSQAQQDQRQDQRQDRGSDHQQRQQPAQPQSPDNNPARNQKYFDDIEDARWTDLN